MSEDCPPSHLVSLHPLPGPAAVQQLSTHHWNNKQNRTNTKILYRSLPTPPPHPPAARAEEELMRLKSSAAMKSSKTSTVVA